MHNCQAETVAKLQMADNILAKLNIQHEPIYQQH